MMQTDPPEQSTSTKIISQLASALDCQRRVVEMVVDLVVADFAHDPDLTDRQRATIARIQALAKTTPGPVYVVSGDAMLGTLDAMTPLDVPRQPAPGIPASPLPQPISPVMEPAVTPIIGNDSAKMDDQESLGRPARRRVRVYEQTPDAAAISSPIVPPSTPKTAIQAVPLEPAGYARPDATPPHRPSPLLHADNVAKPVPQAAPLVMESFKATAPPVPHGKAGHHPQRLAPVSMAEEPAIAPAEGAPRLADDHHEAREDSTIIRFAKGRKLLDNVKASIDDAAIRRINDEFAFHVGSMDRTLHGKSAGALDDAHLRANIGGALYENLSVECLIEWARAGRIRRDDKIAYEGSNKWALADNIFDLREVFDEIGIPPLETEVASASSAAPSRGDQKSGGLFGRLFSGKKR